MQTLIQPFLTEIGILSVPVQPFKGHRINILLLQNKRLLKYVLSYLYVSFYVAGLKALALTSRWLQCHCGIVSRTGTHRLKI